MTKQEAIDICGTLSRTSAMPGYSTGTPAAECITGRELAKLPGTICHECYATKNFYNMPNVQAAYRKRFEGLNHPLWVNAMVVLISSAKETYFRWHDSGDLQSVDHLRRIVAVAVALPHVHFWLPTREYAMVREYLASGAVVPKNLVIRLSAHKIDGPVPNIAGLPQSSVRSSEETLPAKAFRCKKPYQQNTCGACRACWDSKVKHVSYLKH